MEAAAIATASSIVSGINHSMAYQVAGKLILTMEGILAVEVKHPDVVRTITDLDVQASLSTVNALVQDLKPILSKCGATIKVCVENLQSVMTAMQTQLDSVEQKCATHATSWRSYLYSHPNVNEELAQIKSLKAVIDHRIDLLAKAASIELQLMSQIERK